MTTPQAPQRDAAAPALPRDAKSLLKQLDGWTHDVRQASGPCEFQSLSEETDGDGHRHYVEVTEDVDSTCLRARHPDGRALVALWVRRHTAKPSWTLEVAFRAPWPWELHAPQQLTATELTAYVVDAPPRDPREVAREAEQLAHDLAELERYRAMWAANQDVWVPIPLAWSKVAPGRAIVGTGASLWWVVSVTPAQDGPIVRALCDGEEFVGRPGGTAKVLAPVPVRDALTLLRSELGSRIMDAERKTA